MTNQNRYSATARIASVALIVAFLAMLFIIVCPVGAIAEGEAIVAEAVEAADGEVVIATVGNVGFMFDITKLLLWLLELALTFFVGIVTRKVVIPAKAWLEAKTTKEQRENIYATVKQIVNAAEQVFTGAGRGKEKFEYVCRQLEGYHIKVDTDIIESCVKEMNDKSFHTLISAFEEETKPANESCDNTLACDLEGQPPHA